MVGILKLCRTEHAKELRRMQGDKGARYKDKYYEVCLDGLSNTISTAYQDNLLAVVYECTE